MTTSNFLRLVHADLHNVEAYVGDMMSRIDDHGLSEGDVRYKLLNLKAFIGSLSQGIDEYISDPQGLAYEEQK